MTPVGHRCSVKALAVATLSRVSSLSDFRVSLHAGRHGAQRSLRVCVSVSGGRCRLPARSDDSSGSLLCPADVSVPQPRSAGPQNCSDELRRCGRGGRHGQAGEDGAGGGAGAGAAVTAADRGRDAGNSYCVPSPRLEGKQLTATVTDGCESQTPLSAIVNDIVQM